MPFDIGGQILSAGNLGNATQIVTNGLQAYLDAKLPSSYPGSGTTWFDISGNGRNYAWNTTPAHVDGGTFATIGKSCNGPASNSFGINNTSGYTIFLITKTINITSSGAFKFYSSNGSTDSANRGIFSHLTWGNELVYFDQGGCCDANQRTVADSGGSTSSFNLWTLRSTVATRSIAKNSTVLTTNNTAAANINLDSTPASLGSADGVAYGGTAATWDAHLSAFLVYNRGLSDAEIFQNYAALKRIHEI